VGLLYSVKISERPTYILHGSKKIRGTSACLPVPFAVVWVPLFI
jgi:hypothetical protein